MASNFKKQIGDITIWISFDEFKENAVIEIEGNLSCTGPEALPLLQQLTMLLEKHNAHS